MRRRSEHRDRYTQKEWLGVLLSVDGRPCVAGTATRDDGGLTAGYTRAEQHPTPPFRHLFCVHHMVLHSEGQPIYNHHKMEKQIHSQSHSFATPRPHLTSHMLARAVGNPHVRRCRRCCGRRLAREASASASFQWLLRVSSSTTIVVASRTNR